MVFLAAYSSADTEDAFADCPGSINQPGSAALPFLRKEVNSVPPKNRNGNGTTRGSRLEERSVFLILRNEFIPWLRLDCSGYIRHVKWQQQRQGWSIEKALLWLQKMAARNRLPMSSASSLMSKLEVRVHLTKCTLFACVSYVFWCSIKKKLVLNTTWTCFVLSFNSFCGWNLQVFRAYTWTTELLIGCIK